jgi:hypothetical protein
MKKSLTLLAALFLSVTVAAAGPGPQLGNILSHTSVAYGTKKSKKQDIDLLCQQYSSAPAPPTAPFVSRSPPNRPSFR